MEKNKKLRLKKRVIQRLSINAQLKIRGGNPETDGDQTDDIGSGGTHHG